LLTIHRAERADALIGPLAELLSTAPDDPFAPDVVAVPSRGVERWLAQQLSLVLGAAAGGRDGVAANVLFPSPARLVGDVLSTLAGYGRDEDPWVGTRFVWSVLTVIDDCVAKPWCGVLAHHLGADGGEPHRRGRRYATAADLANLFTSYGENRPTLINDWAASSDTDGAGELLDTEIDWQARLWRRLRKGIGVASPAERLAGACATLLEHRDSVDLPSRLSLFGPTRLSRTHLAVFKSLAAHRDVHLWLTHPSPAMWEKLAAVEPAVRRIDDESALALANPLLIGLSRDVRELQQRLPSDAIDVHHPVATSDDVTVLSRVQDDVRHDRIAAGGSRLPNDGSVAIHACHGHARQVEVLREALLHLLNDDQTLQPRDIIVLCPDVDTFAPLIAAAFGQPEAPHPGQRLHVRIADRGPARVNPLLAILQTLVQLADGRVTASDVLDLAAEAPVARRFGFSVDDVATLRHWNVTAGARWGIGTQQREAFGLGHIRQNTLVAARNRILLGVTADETELAWLGTALPLDDVDSSDVDLAGRYAEYLDRLDGMLSRLHGPLTATQWADTFETALDVLTDVGDTHAWQLVQASRQLANATERSGGLQMSLADMRAMLADLFRPRPTRSSFRTGDITIATLVPMRFVPHRVVAIIGLDDEAFPRVASINGDDVLAVNPCLGERDPRSEDRQLLLDAVMAATDNLVICYTGTDPFTGETRPPSPPLADLIDTVTATVVDGSRVVAREPLRPFDTANFVAPHPFSFDPLAYAAAEVAQHAPIAAPPFLPGPLPAAATQQVSLRDLVDFLVHPTTAFLQQRLGVTIPGTDEVVADSVPLALSALQSWDIGDRMLAEMLAGASADVAVQAELRRGTLPPGQLGLGDVDDIAAGARLIAATAETHIDGHQTQAVDIALALGGFDLRGTLPDVYGRKLVTASYSKLAPKHRIAAWVRLLALAAFTGETDWQAVTLGRNDNDIRRGREAVATVPKDPAALLADLLELRATGLREPLPLATQASCAYAQEFRWNPDEAAESARDAWTSEGSGAFRTYRENSEAAICCVFGEDAPFDVLWDRPALTGPQWPDAPNLFAQLALRVWLPLLDGHETVRPVR
jgi:exodeoxyribonuclease V gamma subunit